MQWWLTVALGGIMGGVLGNLYDRLGWWHDANISEQFQYGVRDWILFRFRSYTWPNFNIADSLLVVGAIMLLWHALMLQDPEAEEAPKVEALKAGDPKPGEHEPHASESVGADQDPAAEPVSDAGSDEVAAGRDKGSE